jgi:two-component system LytT family response regulator
MEKKYNAIIVDDEQEAIDYLSSSLEELCPDIHITGTATGSASAVNQYIHLQPDLIFMDIQLDERNGLDVTEEIYNLGYKPYVIFVTAFDQYAIEAFRQNAIDYLLKPVDPEDLRRAVEKFKALQKKDTQYEQLKEFIESSRKKIRFNTREGFILFHPDDIFYIEAAQNYSKVFTTDEKHEIISLNLGRVENTLPAGHFWRISKSHIINTKYLFRVDRKKRECVLVKNEKTVALKLARERIKNMPE